MSKLSNLMGAMNNSKGGGMNPMNMIMGIMSGKMDMQTIVNTMIKQNPQMAQMWEQAQQMSNGKNPQQMEQMVKQMCQQKGIDYNQAMTMLKQLKK